MKIRMLLLGFAILFGSQSLVPAGSGPTHQSKYVGQEKREIKSLSKEDVEELLAGKGWGFAKAAELNGFPGPTHLLDMKKEIRLTADQVEKIEKIYMGMKQRAASLGLKFVELERRLNATFADRTVDDVLLRQLLDKSAETRKKLRYVHLSAHLETPKILTIEQITLYNGLRGYSTGDPCSHVPPGHDPQMWKKHNNCP